MEFVVSLNREAPHEVTFIWATSIETGDTAEADDFTAINSRTETIPVTHQGWTLVVAPINDSLYETNETFTVTIISATNATITDGTAKGTITNTDAQPTLSIAAASATEGDPISSL